MNVVVRSSGARPSRPALCLTLALVALPVLVLTGCGAKKDVRQPRVAVTVARVERRDMPVSLASSGTVEPIQTAAVGSQVGGVVTRLAIREGQDVAAGQVMIELDPRPFRAALAQARANHARDLAQWRSAQLDAERADRMLEQNLIAPADHDKAIAAAEALRGAVSGDSAAVTTARLNLEYAGIRSPISGRAGHLNVHVGDLVKAATSDPLITVNQVRPILVRFTVSQSDVPAVQHNRETGARVFVRPSAADSVELEGRLVFIDNAVDVTTGTLMLKAEFPNRDARLWPGQFVDVRLVLTTQKGALVVPATAVTNGQQGTYVYVLNPDSTTTTRPVTVMRSDDVVAVLAGGVQPGDVVVTDGQFRIGPGARVMVRQPTKDKRP